MKIEEPLAIAIPIETYKQALYFFIDDDASRVEHWIQQQIHDDNFHLTEHTTSAHNNAVAFELSNDVDGKHIFCVWMKWWSDDDRSYGRLAHELIHTAFSLCDWIGWSPRVCAKHSEPVAYLHETIFRDCLTAVEQWKQRAHATAKRKGRTRRLRREKNLHPVSRARVANTGVGKRRARTGDARRRG